jgi:hypothetical protein
MTIQIIRTDGTEETHDVPQTNPFPRIYALMGCSLIDTVSLRDGRVMLVDDAGYEYDVIDHGTGPDGVFRVEHRTTRARKPVNPKATALYHAVCIPDTTHQIVGDVAIVRDADFA